MTSASEQRIHDTPAPVAKALAKHLPKRTDVIVDPSAGIGSLLSAVLPRIKKSTVVHAIDIDSCAIDTLSESFHDSIPNLQVYRSCFLGWLKQRPSLFTNPKIDCVLMNPPFAGRRKDWIDYCDIKGVSSCKSIPDSGPIEAAFLLGALAILKDGGTLLAVLPPTIVASSSLSWLRDFLSESFDVRFVHELPHRSFPKIESRMYLVAIQKRPRRKWTTFLNHDLHRPERIVIEAQDSNQRLDFRFHKARLMCLRIQSIKGLQFKRLAETCEIHRGAEVTPFAKGVNALHTSDRINGFWVGKKAFRRKDVSSNHARAGDIIVSRVSRRCLESLGLYETENAHACSDCLLIIRPKSDFDPEKVLFALRSFLHEDLAAPLVERGTGASYLTAGLLSELAVPVNLCEKCPGSFQSFVEANKKKDIVAMRKAEAIARKWLLKNSR